MLASFVTSRTSLICVQRAVDGRSPSSSFACVLGGLLVLTFLPGLLHADPTAKPVAPPSPALRAFQQGQLALERDRFQEAIGHLQLCLRLDPKITGAHLSLAAAHLALGEDREAAPHMRRYLEAHPEHFLVRQPYAEVLTRLERFTDAAAQLERFVSEVQDHPGVSEEQVIGSHTQLMELAGRLGDEYNERLHRGIGLYLLARKRAEMGGESALKLSEELLCKAAGELTLARVERPDEARPAWYLHGVWTQLGQHQPAERSLRAAQRHAGLSYLTPGEMRGLTLAGQLRQLEHQKR